VAGQCFGQCHIGCLVSWISVGLVEEHASCTGFKQPVDQLRVQFPIGSVGLKFIEGGIIDRDDDNIVRSLVGADLRSHRTVNVFSRQADLDEARDHSDADCHCDDFHRF